MQVKIHNMMSIVDAIVELKETGTHLFLGENSNGKSIIGSVLCNVILGRIENNDIRNSIINDNADSGSIMLVRDLKVLQVTIDRDLSKTFYLYAECSPSGDILSKVVRTFRTGGIKELLSKFGFIFYDNLCLQITETYGLLPFINTSIKLNGDMVKDHVTDNVAKKFIENYKNVTYKALLAKNRKLRDEYKEIESKMQKVVTYDIDLYTGWLSKLKYYYDVLENLITYDYKPLELVPNVTFIEVEPFVVKDFSELLSIKPIEVFYFRVNSTPLLEYVKVIHGVCPTCGKRLIESGGEDHEHCNVQ